MNSAISRPPLALLGSLYVSQSIPLGFFIVALPAIARAEGLGLARVGLLGTLAFPFLLKFLWAPLVDRHGARQRHYTSWIVPLQIVSLLSVIGLAMLRPFEALAETGGSSALLVVVLTALFMFCAATQDAATDGLAVQLIPADARGSANSVQVGGYYLGQILGGGLALLLYGEFGWRAALLSMALPLGLPLLLLIGFREPNRLSEDGDQAADRRGVGFASLKEFFSRSGVFLWLLILLGYRAGESMALAMLNPMLVDFGFSLASVGLSVGLVGSLASLGGALVGGLIAGRWSRRRALVGLGLFQSVALLGYLGAASSGSWASVLVAVSAVSFAGGAATVALYTAMMDRCRRSSAASDFTVQQSLCAVGPLLGVGLSGVSAATLGYGGHFVLCAATAGCVALLAGLRLTERHGALPAPELSELAVRAD